MLNETVNFDDVVTLTRPGSADYEDANGDTQTAGPNEPRFNYSEGVGEGLLLDASIDEVGALVTVPGYSASQGTWVIDAELTQSQPIPGSGFGEFMNGAGVAVFVYKDGAGKCWADGEVLFTIDPINPAIADYLTQGGNAKFKSLTYDPVPWSDTKAAEAATGVFETYFSPEKLFANAEEGAWFDPSDLSTLFQDATGTTPVTSDGDPVGLMLDKSKGLELGSDLVTNGDFGTGDLTDWSAAPIWSVTGGRAYSTFYDGSVSGSRLGQTALTVGGYYELSFDLDVVQGGITFNDGTVTNTFDFETSGTKTVRFRAEGDLVRFQRIAGIGFEGYIDNVSAKLVEGNHSFQSVSSYRRLYRTNATLSWLEDDLTDDVITALLPDLGTDATLAYSDASGVAILTGQTISGATDLPTTAETYGVIYIDRALTTAETEKVTTYLDDLRGA